MQDFRNAFNTGLGQDLKQFPTFVTAYEGEGDGTPPVVEVPPVVDVPPTPPEGDTPPKKAEGSEKLMNQAQVDKIIQERLARADEQARKASSEQADQLESLTARFEGTAEEKNALQDQIEKLRNESMSAEEKAAREKRAMEEDLQGQISSLTDERDAAVKDHAEFRIKHELRDGANKFDARNPDQLVRLLFGDTTLQDEIGDDGKPTGEKVVRVKVQQIKEDGERYSIELDPMKAMQALVDMPKEWGNQFNSRTKGGSGDLWSDGNAAPTGQENPDIGKMSYQQYKKWRDTDAGKRQLGRT